MPRYVIDSNALRVDKYLRTDFNFCCGCGDMVNTHVENLRFFKGNKDAALQQGLLASKNILGASQEFSLNETVPEYAILDNLLSV